MGALRALSQTEIMFESPIPENYCCLMRNGCESQAEALIERGRGRSPDARDGKLWRMARKATRCC
jgi:hypothetical protein